MLWSTYNCPFCSRRWLWGLYIISYALKLLCLSRLFAFHVILVCYRVLPVRCFPWMSTYHMNFNATACTWHWFLVNSEKGHIRDLMVYFDKKEICLYLNLAMLLLKNQRCLSKFFKTCLLGLVIFSCYDHCELLAKLLVKIIYIVHHKSSSIKQLNSFL